jgi:membrane-associated phospholipid phosphatase
VTILGCSGRGRFFLVLTVCFAANIGSAQAANKGFETFGDIGSYGIPVAAAAVSLHKKDYEGLLQLGLTYGATFGVTRLLKETVNATRPNDDPHSFPSGHTSRAFSGASYLHYRYGIEYGLPAYALAAAVGYSRVANDKHYWHDVIAGAAIANLSAYLLTNRYESEVEFGAFFDTKNGRFGVSLYRRF